MRLNQKIRTLVTISLLTVGCETLDTRTERIEELDRGEDIVNIAQCTIEYPLETPEEK